MKRIKREKHWLHRRGVRFPIREGLPAAIQRHRDFRALFDIIACHGDWYPRGHGGFNPHPTEIPPNTCLLFWNFSDRLPATFRMTLRIPNHVLQRIGGIAYDCRHSITIYEENTVIHPFFSVPVTGIEFHTPHGRHLGVYYPEVNVLIGTDWTHNYEDFAILWPYIKEQLPLKRVDLPSPFDKEKDRYIPISIGCDPEAELIDPASGDCLAASMVIDGGVEAELGVDGAGSPVEFRPPPGSPEDVVRELERILKRFSDEYPTYDLSPVGNNIPIGCHIHIGFGHPVDPPPSLIELLDDFIGRPLSRLNGKARGTYASLGAWRSQPWGFEYRTPPAAAIASPRIARIVFKLAYNLVDLYVNKKDPIEYSNPPDVGDYVRLGGLSEKEARMFLAYCNSAYLPASLLAAWRLPAPKIPSIHLTFRDDWHISIANALRQDLEKRLTEMKRYCRYPLVLYGLHEDRGFVATIPIDGIDLLPEEKAPYSSFVRHGGAYWIGLPRAVRVDIVAFEEHRERIANGIIRYLKRKRILRRPTASRMPPAMRAIR